MSGRNNEELEQFRRQWQAEVSSRQRRSSKESTAAPSTSGGLGLTEPVSSRKQLPSLGTATTRETYQDTYVRGTYNFDHLEARDNEKRVDHVGAERQPVTIQEPQSALEHFERAVEKEAQGNMQESLIHYRKAYKLDSRVDLTYRNKYFPPTKFQSKITGTNASHPAVTVPNTAHHSLHGGSSDTLSDLLHSFSGATIEASTPEVEGAHELPCPIATIPREILTLILGQIALMDAASLMRLSYVCKQLAYLVHVEDSLWRSVCWRSRFGFFDMHYDFAMTTKWSELPRRLGSNLTAEMGSLSLVHNVGHDVRSQLLPKLDRQYPTWLDTFRSRPRIRFSGVYISTVNYVRAGASSANSVYWGNSPVHMVTYYRYLRFYRDGSAVSLLTTYEPNDVVPAFHKKNVLGSKGAGGAKEKLPNVPATSASMVTSIAAHVQPPTINAMMKDARKSRWRLSPLHDWVGDEQIGEEQALEPEGNVYIEMEGPTPQYTYHMQLALRSVRAVGVAQNTKLAWRSFWSHNHISDDWAEFSLRNDKAFVFSRVKSWADA